MAHWLVMDICRWYGSVCYCGSGSVPGLGNFSMLRRWPKKEKERKKKKGCIWSWDRGLCREDSSEKVRLCPDLQGEEGQASELSWNQGLEAGLHSQTGRTSSLQNSICFLQWSPCCPAASTLWLDAPSLPPPLQLVLRVTASN